MPAKIMNGNKLSEKILQEVKKDVSTLKKKGIIPGLAVILVGNDPASQLYVGLKNKRAEEVGIYSEQINFPETISEEKLLKKIEDLNKNPKINGILVQLPLPKQINKRKIIEAIIPEKDVDGFTSKNFGNLALGDETFAPATPKGVIKLLEEYNIEIKGKECCIVGAGDITGKPLAIMLLNRFGTITVCHIETKDLKMHTQKADILVSAVGKANLITKEMVKKNAVAVDVGISKVNEKIVGDFSSDVKEVASYITPVPGGVGPMTVACLMENTVIAAKLQNGLSVKK